MKERSRANRQGGDGHDGPWALSSMRGGGRSWGGCRIVEVQTAPKNELGK